MSTANVYPVVILIYSFKILFSSIEMDNIPPNSDRPNEPQNDSDSSNNDIALLITNPEESSEISEARRNRGVTGGNSLESEEATSTSGAVTSASSTEVESLAASLIRAQEEHRRAEAEMAKEEKTVV